MGKLRVAIISNDDSLWSLYAWNNVFNLSTFTKDNDCIGFWNCDQKLHNKKKYPAWKLFLTTFRFWNFAKLAAFLISFKIFSFIKSLAGKYHFSFTQLCKAHNIPYNKIPHPNHPDFINWVKNNNIDVLIIMVDHILKIEIINAPKICVVNKHSGLLPSNKGLLPFFWAYLTDTQQGITFHKVTNEIDKGDFFYQEKVENPQLLKSMIVFYFYVHKNYYTMLDKVLKNIVAGTPIPLNEKIPSSYHSFPEAKDYAAFKKKGGKIITLSDLFLPITLFKKI